MFNPQRLSLVVRVFRVFAESIETSERIFNVLDQRPADFPSMVVVNWIAGLWIIYELAVDYKPIEIESFKTIEQR